MTMDKSLRVARGLTRPAACSPAIERITRLKAADRWQEGESPFGLPKVRVYKLAIKQKKKKKKEDEEGAEGAAAAPEPRLPARLASRPARGPPVRGSRQGARQEIA